MAARVAMITAQKDDPTIFRNEILPILWNKFAVGCQVLFFLWGKANCLRALGLE